MKKTLTAILTLFFAAGLSFGQNLLNDSSFESGNLSTWNLTGDSADCYAEKNKGNAHSGEWSYHYWKKTAFTASLDKKITGLSNGTYKLSVWSMGGGGENAIKLFARNFDNSEKEISAQIKNTGWKKWKQYQLKFQFRTERLKLEFSLTRTKKTGEILTT